MYELGQDTSFRIKYRESIYKALEKLVDSGLVEKKLMEGRGICYRVVKKKLVIDLSEETIG